MHDTGKYTIHKIVIANPGSGYDEDDSIILSFNSESVTLIVTEISPSGEISKINFDYLISNVDIDTGETAIPGLGGLGSGAMFKIETFYGISDRVLMSKLENVTDKDPLVQHSMIMGYLKAGEGILIEKQNNELLISAVPPDYEAITITFINTDQNGDPI
jgi:hypothetical protein